MSVLVWILLSIAALLSELIIYTIVLRVFGDYYRPMSNEQVREQKILRGLYE